METAYLGESFNLEFEIYDAKDRERTPDSATFITRVDGGIVASGDCSIDGNIVSFRFEAKEEGMHEIEIQWAMGADRWKAKHLLNVRP